LSLLEPVALAGLAVLPILVLLWLMRRRRPEIRVSAAFLWEQAAREARVDSFARRLQAHLLLLLQLLLAALLTLSLARPWLQIPSSSAAEVAILIDTSASMGAELDGSTRFEKARTQARRLLHRAPPGAQVLLAGYDRTARILVPFSRDRSAALRALDRLSPREVAGDSQVGLALAASLLASRPLAEAFLLGDRPPRPPLPSRLRFLDCGGPASNVGLVALRAARGRAGTFPLVVGLRNYTDRPQQRELELRRGGLLVASRRIGLPAGGRQVAHFTLTATGSEEVEARLVGGDALATDDRAWTVLPRAASVAGRAVGVGNLFAEQALLAVPGVRLERAVGAAGADLVLWEQEAPWPLPEGTHILLAVPTPLGRGEPREGPFALQAEESTLTRGVPLNDLAVAGVRPLEIPPGAEVLARAGPHPALVRVRQGSTTALLFCFDLYRSELPLSPALPLLFANLVDEIPGAGRGPVAPEAIPGQPLLIRSPKTVRVQLPGGTSVLLEATRGTATLTDPDRVGLYRVHTEERDWPVAVNMLDERESDLSGGAPPPGADPRPSSIPIPSEGGGGMEIWPWVAAGSLFLLLAEWLLYHRRRA